MFEFQTCLQFYGKWTVNYRSFDHQRTEFPIQTIMPTIIMKIIAEAVKKVEE